MDWRTSRRRCGCFLQICAEHDAVFKFHRRPEPHGRPGSRRRLFKFLYGHESRFWRELMKSKRSKLGVFEYALVLLAVFSGPLELASAQDSKGAIPANSTAKSYGSGWECDKGFRMNGGSCIAVTSPKNAYLTNSSYGDGWACRHGYRKKGDTCSPVALPANAYLSGSSGDRWLCDRGFRQVKDTCEAISVPENGYLTASSSGSGWTCERGFRATADTCAAIAVPDNAYMTDRSYDAGWECNRGYQEKNGNCERIVRPEFRSRVGM